MDGCSEKTIKRTIDTMRNYYYAPITYYRGKGWQYDASGENYELPGIWFSIKELVGLASLLRIIEDMQSERLNEELSNVSSLIDDLLDKHGLSSDLFKYRIRILAKQQQTLNTQVLDQISQSLIKQNRMLLHYQSYSGSKTEREISPIKLIYYQESWYLDAYCHLRQELRSFKVNRFLDAQIMQIEAHKIPSDQADAHYQASYGIFSGYPKYQAILLFYDDAAREVAMQEWHPEQQGEWIEQGYRLSIPYNDDRELIQEILRYADNIEVIAPVQLKEKIIDISQKILLRHQRGVGRSEK